MGEFIYVVSLGATYLLCIALEFKRKSSFLVLWLGLGLIFYFPIVFDIIFRYKVYNYSTYTYAAFFAILFNLVYFFTRFFFGRKNLFTLKIDNTHSNKVFLKICNLFLITAVLGVAVYYVLSGISITSVTWSDKQELGPFMGLMIYFYYFGCISVFLSFLMRSKKIFFMSILYVMAFILLTQSRAIIIPVIIPFLVYMLVYKKKFFLFISIAFSSMFVFFLLQQIRYAGGIDNFFDNDVSIILNNTRDKILADDNEFSLINSFYKIIESPQTLNRFNEFATFKRMLMVFYPDVLNSYLEIKPLDFTYDIYTHYYGYEQGTFHPTFFGLIYANAGYFFGVVSAIFFGIVISLFDRLHNYLYRNGETVLYFCTVVSCCHISMLWARGSIYNGWSQGLFMIVLSMMVMFLVKRISFK